MIAILLAAQLSATVAGASFTDVVAPDVTVHRHAAPVFTRNNLPVRPEVLCPSAGATDASDTAPSLLRPQDRKDLRARKLADLPKANKEVAVARTIGGCAVPVGVRYSVEGNGRFAK